MLEYSTYEATAENFQSVLDKYGVCVIPDVIPREQLMSIRSSLWYGLSSMMNGRFNIHDKSTWQTFHELLPLYGMMVHHYSIGHLQAVWDVRQIKKIGDIFGRIYNIDRSQLKTSFDAISVSMPPEITGKGWYEGRDWFHLDHSPKRRGFACVQGLVNLYDVQEGDATLRILEGSHVHTDDFFETVDDLTDRDWFPLSCDQLDYYKTRGCRDKCVLASAGSLVLWDSRTVHQGVEPSSNRKSPNFRATFYICMRQVSMFTNEQLEMRQRAFRELRMTNHWGISLFKQVPDTEDAVLPTLKEVSEPVLSDYGRSLI